MPTRGRKKLPASADALNMIESWIKDDAAMQQMLAEERSNAAIARQIHALRTARGLTQRELADLVGTKQPVIARLEDADYEGHSLSMLSRIGEALGCSVSVSFVPRSLATGVSMRASVAASRASGKSAKNRGKARKRSAA